VIEKAGQLEIPAQCPVCHHETKIVESESGTRKLQCTNPTCPAKQLKKFARFVSKEGMNIDGISEQTLSRFVNLGSIQEYADIFRLLDQIREIAHLDGFGERSASNIMRSIDKARNVEAQRFLYSLSIPMVGIDVCKRLLSTYPLEELVMKAREATETEFFSHIPGIGPEKSSTFISWFKNDDNFQIVSRLLEFVKVSHTQPQRAGQKCEGMTFVITGDVHHFKNRNELKAYIESQGGKVAGSVSGSTSFLINNDVTSTSGKNKKAQELNIPILSEDDFMERFGSAAPQAEQLSLF
jgi:DNA ligase (NAD+)